MARLVTVTGMLKRIEDNSLESVLERTIGNSAGTHRKSYLTGNEIMLSNEPFDTSTAKINRLATKLIQQSGKKAGAVYGDALILNAFEYNKLSSLIESKNATESLNRQNEVVFLVVGKKYPLPIPPRAKLDPNGGAAAQFFGGPENILQIVMPRLLASEKNLLKSARMKAGIIVEGGAIAFVFCFGDLIFECPFNINILPKKTVLIPDITSDTQRLLLHVHVIDTHTMKLEVLKAVTITPALTKSIIEAAKNQLTNNGDFEKDYRKIMKIPVNLLPVIACVSSDTVEI